MHAGLAAALIGLALAGLPLYAVLALAGLAFGAVQGLDPALLIVELRRLADSPTLPAIPLFTLAGVVLARGGAAERLFDLFQHLLGRLPGGIAVVALVTAAVFTAFSGASGVTILALGGLLFPLLQRAGYGDRFAAGLVTSSGSIGLLFPPSLAVLLYGVVAGVSIDELFLAGLVPGLLLIVLLGAYSAWTGRHIRRQPRENIRRGNPWRGLPDALLPVWIVVAVAGGWLTPTEAAALTAWYAIVLEGLIHRTLRGTAPWLDIAREASLLTGSLLLVLGMALGITNLIVDSALPMRFSQWTAARVDNAVQFLLLLNLALLLAGCLLDLFSATLVLVPLILPLAAHYGIDPVHLGIVFLANLEIGYLTPPVGINLFIASQRLNQPILTLFRAALPFIGFMLLWLVAVTYVPALSLWWR